MKILIIEDSVHKYNSTKKYIESILPEAQIVWREFAKGGVWELEDKEYDFAFIDMQMPLNERGSIDREGGIYVLNYIKRGISKNKDIKYCINSSSNTSRVAMEDKGFEQVPFILNSSMYNSEKAFRDFLLPN